MTTNKLLFSDCLQLNTYKTGSDDSGSRLRAVSYFPLQSYCTKNPRKGKDLREKADCRQSAHLTPMILKLRIKQGNKFGTLKKAMFRLFDVIIFDK